MAFRLAAGGWTPTPIGARTRVISRARRTTPAWRCAIGWISERSEPQPDRHRSGVGGKAFSPREADRGRADLAERFGRTGEKARPLHEIGAGQARRKAGAAAGGQAMVGPAAIHAHPKSRKA